MTEKSKPAHKIRSGALTVTLWKHEGDKGPWFTATPMRSYKQGDEWKETNSYGQEDFLELAEMFREARAWVIKEKAAAKAVDQGRDPDQSRYSDRETGRKRAGGQER